LGRSARAEAGGGTPARFPLLAAVAITLLAINLRPAAASVGPLIGRITRETGLPAAGGGALVTLPVLCFGVLAPLAPAIARRLGTRAALAASLAALLAGLLIRLGPGVGPLFIGTALAGGAIAVANVLLPVLVRHEFPRHTGILTGLYTTALIAFAAIAAAASVPAANALGGGWRPGLAIWAAPAALALAVWLPDLRSARREPGQAAEQRAALNRSLLRSPVAWAVTVFFGLQSAGFYAALAWLPSIYHSHGASLTEGGLLLGFSMIIGLAPALLVPVAAVRLRDQRLLAVACTACIALGWLGLLLAPMSAPFLWAALLGVGQQGAFPLAIAIIVLRSASSAETAALSTLAQAIGYLLAAGAPVGIGALHQLSGSWDPALALLLALTLPQALLGLVAGHGQARAAPPAAAGAQR
jgi:CP family cyanate transporter-like MFS transporter